MRTRCEDDVVDAALATAARDGDAPLFDTILAAAKSEPDTRRRERLLAALGQLPRSEAAHRTARSVCFLTNDVRRARLTLDVFVAAVGFGRDTRPYVHRFLLDHNGRLPSARLRDDEASVIIEWLGEAFCDDASRRTYDSLFRDRVKRIAGAQFALDRALDQMGQCAATQTRLLPAVTAFLAKY